MGQDFTVTTTSVLHAVAERQTRRVESWRIATELESMSKSQTDELELRGDAIFEVRSSDGLNNVLDTAEVRISAQIIKTYQSQSTEIRTKADGRTCRTW